MLNDEPHYKGNNYAYTFFLYMYSQYVVCYRILQICILKLQVHK